MRKITLFSMLITSFCGAMQANIPPVIHTVKQSTKTMTSNDEIHALELARTFLLTQNHDEYQKLKNQWTVKTTHPTEWTFLDAEQFVLKGKRQQAIDILSSFRTDGKLESERLIRLAALHLLDNSQLAWDYLSDASLFDPTNADVHLYRASMLETANRHDLTIKEYRSALQKSPESSYFQELLFDTYLRTGQFQLAMESVPTILSANAADSILIKMLFWSKITHPVHLPQTSTPLPTGELAPFIAYLRALPPNTYWDEKSFIKLPRHQEYLHTRQETFWLQLLHALKNHHETTAIKLLEDNPFKTGSWAPDLEKSLSALLHHRQSIDSNDMGFTQQSTENNINTSNSQNFLTMLSSTVDFKTSQFNERIPANLIEILSSNDAFSIPFLAQGWNEAALQLFSFKKLPSNSPEWIAIKFTKALDDNRNAESALNFAFNQSSSPELLLVAAEIAIADGQTELAMNSLKTIYETQNAIGSRAALLIAPLFLGLQNTKAAKDAILAHPSLANNIKARELLARAFNQEGDKETAYRLYISLEPYSLEAKSFLAHKAFIDHDWTRAKNLTEELIKAHPDNKTLKANLKSIITEQETQ